MAVTPHQTPPGLPGGGHLRGLGLMFLISWGGVAHLKSRASVGSKRTLDAESGEMEVAGRLQGGGAGD